MELQSRGVGVVSSAAAPVAGANQWWKGTVIAKKPELGADKHDGPPLSHGDWKCQVQHIDATAFK